MRECEETLFLRYLVSARNMVGVLK